MLHSLLSICINHSVSVCYAGLTAVYATMGVAAWRMRHRVLAIAYIVAAVLVGIIAASSALAR